VATNRIDLIHPGVYLGPCAVCGRRSILTGFPPRCERCPPGPPADAPPQPPASAAVVEPAPPPDAPEMSDAELILTILCGCLVGILIGSFSSWLITR